MFARSILVIAAALCLVAGAARADSGTEVVPSLPPPDESISARAQLRADVDLWSTLAAGSPVAIRAHRDRARRQSRGKRSRFVMRRFRKTQRGRYDRRIADAAREWGVDPFLLKGLLTNESRLQNKVGKKHYKRIGGKRRLVAGGARGIAQFTTMGISAVNEVRQRRHKRGERVFAFTEHGAMDPYLSIDAAAELLGAYIERFGRDGGVTAYNSGPYGGRLVRRHGFHGARHRLRRVGHTHIQGHRFLPNVLSHTNRLRKKAGLRPLVLPENDRAARKRALERVRAEKAAPRS